MSAVRVEAEDAKLGAEHSSARIRVVLADDALLLRQALAEGLKAAGFDVVGQAGDVAGLLSLVETQAPDVAVVDVRMPPTHTTEASRRPGRSVGSTPAARSWSSRST